MWDGAFALRRFQFCILGFLAPLAMFCHRKGFADFDGVPGQVDHPSQHTPKNRIYISCYSFPLFERPPYQRCSRRLKLIDKVRRAQLCLRLCREPSSPGTTVQSRGYSQSGDLSLLGASQLGGLTGSVVGCRGRAYHPLPPMRMTWNDLSVEQFLDRGNAHEEPEAH